MSTLRFGTPGTLTRKKLLLLGAGELGKEVAIEAQRLCVEVVACDRYDDAPAMQVAHRRHVFPMQERERLRAVIQEEQPDFVVPEIEAIDTELLLELEAEGQAIVPTARATRLTMDREGIRRLAAEELGLPTSPYRFAGDLASFRAAVEEIGLPCVVKPVMSSSGKGQSTVREASQIDAAWKTAREGARGKGARVIVEGFVDFDYEITLLTVRHQDGDQVRTSFCAPIGHRQVGGDYHESWQPQAMSVSALAEAERIARAVTGALGGRGLFGVELFVKGKKVWFSEVSPRPHDTGMVTLATQDLSEFALHVRAILGLPIPSIRVNGPGASAVVLAEGKSRAPLFTVDTEPLREPDTSLRLFGKPEVAGHRRMGVALARGENVEEARQKARAVAASVNFVPGD